MSITVPQTTYNQFPGIAIDGMLAEAPISGGIDTYLTEDALVAGRFVCTGDTALVPPSPQSCQLPEVATDVSAGGQGFVIYTAAKMPVAGAGEYKAKDAVPVLRKGKIWIFPEGDVVDDGPVYIVNGSGAGTPGRLRGDANTAAATIVHGAVVRRGATASSGLPALVEINLPVL